MESSPIMVDLRGRRILVAGATSYLASRLAPVLLGSGAGLIALVRREADVSRLPPALRHVQPVLLSPDLDRLAGEMARQEADTIVNCITSYGRGGVSAVSIADANLMAPLRLLEAARSASLKLFLSIGSALPPSTNLYALAKSQFVDLARLANLHDVRFCNARCEMFFGPGEPDQWKLPTHLVRSLARGVATIALSPGEQERDFIHVDDLSRAIVTLLAHEIDQGPGFEEYDVGSGRPVTIRAFAEAVKRLSGANTELAFGALPYRANEPMKVSVDPSKLMALGWSPELSLERGIRLTLDAEAKELP